jgi:DNA-binding transcriptional regulator LsrR (DeoR family)
VKNISDVEEYFKSGFALNSMSPFFAADEEAALAARAAWLHFAGGKTQGEVAELLGVQSTKAHRLIAKARNDGLIRIIVEGPIAGCIQLEEQLKAQFGLANCEVVPNIDEGSLPLRTLGAAGARYLRNIIENEQYRLIGFGHGRTLAAAVELMASVKAGRTKFVSLLGGLTRRYSASPYDVMHRLAERTSAEAHVLPVPFFANGAEDKEVLEAQFGVAEAISMRRSADLYVAGIGDVSAKNFIVSAGMIDDEEIAEITESGAAAELLGHFFSENGKHLPNGLSDRAIAPSLEDLKRHRIVALAGGTSKTLAIRAILESGLLHGLIVDEATAKRLVATRAVKSAGRNSKPNTSSAEE